VSTIVIMTFFIWLTSVALRHSDQERQDALVELHRQRESLRMTLVSIADAVIATDHRREVSLMNAAAEALTGWTLPEARGRPLSEIFPIVDEKTGNPLGDPTAQAQRENEIIGLMECSLIRKDESKIPIEHTTAPILNQKGKVGGAVLIFRDITDRRRAEDQQRMMVGELNHRVRNVLMIVQSLVQASAQHTGDKSAKEMSKTLTDRVQSLGRAHELLLNTHWTGASFKQMVEMELAPFRQDSPRKIVLRGKDVLLTPQCTSVIAMALHELATNAAKYGALSRPEGELSVKWAVKRSILTINWIERNIEVRDGRSTGFGTRLIDRGIRQNLGGDATLEFHDNTLTVTMSIPLEDGVQVKPAAKARQASAP
jgi:PAS domain S-box-containing protein